MGCPRLGVQGRSPAGAWGVPRFPRRSWVEWVGEPRWSLQTASRVYWTEREKRNNQC